MTRKSQLKLNASGPRRKYGVPLTKLAEFFSKSAPTIREAVDDGMPTTTVNDARIWALSNRPSWMPKGSLETPPEMWTKTDWEKFKLQKVCRDLDFEHEARKGKYHDAAECCQSLGRILSERLQPLLSLHQRIKSRYPELPPAAMEAIRVEIDETFAAIREGIQKPTTETPA